jgi:biopolymer transport protein TolQ
MFACVLCGCILQAIDLQFSQSCLEGAHPRVLASGRAAIRGVLALPARFLPPVSDRHDFTRSVKPMTPAMVLLQIGTGLRASVFSLVLHSSPFAKGILLLLAVVSVYAWAVIWNRLTLFGRVERADKAFLGSFRKLSGNGDCRLMCEQHPASLLAKVALAGQQTLDRHASDAGLSVERRWELAMRAMDRRASEESGRLEQHVGFLATTGSVSPFVGLMGTVWGVMSAFLNIGTQGSASLVVVAPGIAEALIATVAGLAAAIPAVVAYNHCLARLRDLGNGANLFASEFIDRRSGPSS